MTPPVEPTTTFTPVTPIDAAGGSVTERLPGPRVPVPDSLLERLRSVCADVSTGDADRAEAGRDWWPIAIRWAMRGSVPALPGAVAHPGSAAEVAAVLACCHEARVPVVPVAGRSGVCGGDVPVFGGVALDLLGLAGVTDVDTGSLVCDVLPGTFGPDLEGPLHRYGLTLGHWPQSMTLSTVGGWVACRGAGQYSTRYGKIEDMVVGLEVALADGTVVTTGGRAPRAAVGPDLTQLFVGSEGTLGVVTSARLRLHVAPDAEGRRAWGFDTFAEGLDACRRVLRRGATPAVLRLYDASESSRHFGTDGTHVLVCYDEADQPLLDATLDIVDHECRAGSGVHLDESVVEQWFEHRNDVSQLAPLYRAGIVVDTVEMAARWSALPALYESCMAALGDVPGTLVASAHQSHSYTDGACLYFTFAGRMPADLDGSGGTDFAGGDPVRQDAWAERYYTDCWDAVTRAVIDAGGAISHHHGVGLNRSRFVAGALGGAERVLVAVKEALDPRGILNPGKLGLPSPFGEVRWP